MLNTADLEQLVREQVAKSVNNEIVGLLDSTEWLNTVENSIIDFAQQRVVAKFNNAESMEQILESVEDSVKRLFENGTVSSIKDLVSEEDLERIVKKELDRSVDRYVNVLFSDNVWLSEVRKQVIATLLRNIKKELTDADINAKVKDIVQSLFNEYVKTIEYNGIDDRAVKTELTVMNGAVVVENDFAATNIQAVESLVSKQLFVDELSVAASINFEGRAWDELKDNIQARVFQQFESDSKQNLIEDIIEHAESSGIDFAQVMINGQNLVSGDTLSSSITKTNIQRLGFLDEISVRGEADFNDTAFVAKKRVGINTREPSSALSVWDEEIEIAVGKRKERTGFIGTNRKQHLEIGVNGKGNITIKDDGLVVIDQLQVGKQRIGHGSDVPGYSGSKGDIVFNINVGPKNPVFAWMCVGGFNWVALSASIS